MDGVIEGLVNTAFDISVGKTGKITGTVKAREVVVSGVVEGSLVCDRLELLCCGSLKGDVAYRTLVIQAGGRFVGESREMKVNHPLKQIGNQ